MAAGWKFHVHVLFLHLTLHIYGQHSTASISALKVPLPHGPALEITHEQGPLIAGEKDRTLIEMPSLISREMKFDSEISHSRRTRSADLNRKEYLFSGEIDGFDDMENLQNVMSAATYESRKINSIRPDRDRNSLHAITGASSVPAENVYYEVPRKHSTKSRSSKIQKPEDLQDVPDSRLYQNGHNILKPTPPTEKYNPVQFRMSQTRNVNTPKTQNRIPVPAPTVRRTLFIPKSSEPDHNKSPANFSSDSVTSTKSKRKKSTENVQNDPQMPAYNFQLLKKYDIMPRPFAQRNQISSNNDLFFTPIPPSPIEPVKRTPVWSNIPIDPSRRKNDRRKTAESAVGNIQQPIPYSTREQLIVNPNLNSPDSNSAETERQSIPLPRKREKGIGLRGRKKFDQVESANHDATASLPTNTPPLRHNREEMLKKQEEQTRALEKPDTGQKQRNANLNNGVEYTENQYPRKYQEIKRPRKINDIEDESSDYKSSSEQDLSKSIPKDKMKQNPVPRADYDYDYGQHPVQIRKEVVEDVGSDYSDQATEDLAQEGDEHHEKKHDDDHEDKAVDEKQEEGGEEEHEEGDHDEHGEKAHEGYKGWHEHDKGEKGHHTKEEHSKHYDEKDGAEKEHEDEGGYHEHYDFGEHGEKKAGFGEKGKHEKGHSTKGQHVIHKKDEYEKKTEFFDEFHDDGDIEKDGAYHQEHEQKKGGHHKSGHHHEEADEGKHGKAGKYEKGLHHHEKKGHDAEEGQDSHHYHEEKYGKKGEHEEKKKWSHKKGDAGSKEEG